MLEKAGEETGRPQRDTVRMPVLIYSYKKIAHTIQQLISNDTLFAASLK
jgi:hypothetical protein